MWHHILNAPVWALVRDLESGARPGRPWLYKVDAQERLQEQPETRRQSGIQWHLVLPKGILEMLGPERHNKSPRGTGQAAAEGTPVGY